MSIAICRPALCVAAALAASILAMSPASATSERVRTACTSDYLNFCSQYDPDSFQTIDCMKRNQKRLSKVCKVAVQEDGIPATRKRVVSRQR